MKDFWNNTYRSIKSVYGNEPNEYFKTQLLKLKSGKILLPAEGEGRNAVFAAKLGWEVSAFDFSKEAKIKAESKAKKNHVEIDYKLGTPNSLNYPENYFDCIALIYAHFPSNLKVSYHKKLSKYLRKNGIIIFEAFSKAHAELKAVNGKKSGPLDVNMLFSIEEIKNNFCNYKIIELKENQINLNEGLFHIGESKVIRFIGKKL
jgi:2-polyprenyl-3-methyl-5-hydroxy-6-metoxy-1,4-benzoquinol methylase